jgi:hypothetical protein
MLNLMIAMRPLIVLLLLFLLLALPPSPALAQDDIDTPTPTTTATATPTPTPPAQPQLTLPTGGEAVQGQVTISGVTGVPGFFYAEISFAYPGDPTGTWFLIAESFTPEQSGPLATWDTFAITDGTYDVRLVITLIDGREMESILRGLRVRNYSQIETVTPTPSLTPTTTPTVDRTQAFVPSETPTLTPTVSPPPSTVTPLPPNPAEITPPQFGDTLLRGAAGTLAVFLLLGMYASLRRRRT